MRPETREAMEMLLQIAEKNNSEVFAHQYDWVVSADDNKQMIYESQQKNLTLPAPSLQGDHQYLNAGNAITAVDSADWRSVWIEFKLDCDSLALFHISRLREWTN